MNDFDFDFEFDFGGGVNELDINAICKEMTRSERIVFDLAQGTRQLKYLLRDFDENKDYRFLSNGKGFSSINFIDWVCSSFGEIEQFCFMCDKSLYLWYEKFFKALKQC